MLEKNFTSPSFDRGWITREGTLPEPDPKQQAEYDRLLHRRKGMSGSEFAGVGMQFAITIVVFAFLGLWLDRRLGTSPWIMILMVFGGAAIGFWTMYRAMVRSGKR